MADPITEEQLAWCRRCKRLTGFEPNIDPAKSFYENASSHLEWFVNWANDMKQQLERDPVYRKAVEEKYA